MKATNKSVYEGYGGFKQLAEISLPVRIAFAIKMAMRKMEPIVQAVEECRTSLIQQYGEQRPQGGFAVNFETDKGRAFVEEIETLFAQEVDLDFDPIEVPCEVGGQPINISAAALSALEDFITIRMDD